jgi:ankyrin repeat protein
MRGDWNKAVIDGDCRTVERLLPENVDIDSRDRYGQTVLMLAAQHGRNNVVRLLLEKGADMDVTAKYGLSALMLAVINRHTGIARQLVDAGANTRLRGSGAPGFAHRTARELAEQGGLVELAAFIARSGRAEDGR